MTDRTRPEPWGDDRIAAAFSARAARTRTPTELPGATSAMLRTTPRSASPWRRLVAPAAVIVVATLALAGGTVLLDDQLGSSGLVEFRDGPSADLRTLDARDFAVDYPAGWLAFDSTAFYSGGSSIAVLGSRPVEGRCGDEGHVDINCVYEQVLEPGDIRVFVGTGSYRGGSIFDRIDIENGTTTRLEIAGSPAIFDEFDPQPESYYREDVSLQWSIARPGTNGTNVIRIEALLREPRTAVGRAQVEALVASFRFDKAALATPADAWAGHEAAGLPVISVEDAIAVRDAGADDREIAVHGWFHPMAPVPCPAFLDPPTSPVQSRCPDQFIWLTQEPEALTTVDPDGLSGGPPTGPAIHPDLDLLDQRWTPAMPDAGPATPVEVVFVGHFDDRRAQSCPDAEDQACRDQFVVDRVDWVNGESLALSVVNELDGAPVSTIAEVQAIVNNEAPLSPMLSIAVVDGASGIGRVEPTLTDGVDGFTARAAIWVVRVLESERISTYLIPDGTDEIYELRPDGPPVLVGGGERPEPAGPAAPVEPATFTFELTGVAGKPVPIDVLDLTNLLEDAREATSEQQSRPWAPEPSALTIDNLAPDTILVRWTGSVCDRRPQLTVDPAPFPGGPPRVLQLSDERPGCDAIGVGRGIVLRFSEDVPAEDIIGTEAAVVVEPPPSSVVGLEVVDVEAALQVQAREREQWCDHRLKVQPAGAS